MTASVLWEPVDPNPEAIGCWAPDWFRGAMERAGMELPCTLGKEHLPTLKGMAASFGDHDAAPNPFAQIIEKIEKHGKISVWLEH